MIYLPLEMLRPNMVLAKSVPSPNMRLDLMTAGQAITQEKLQQFALHRIQGAYVECEVSDDVDVEPFIAPEVKQELLVDIKAELDKCRVRHGMPAFQRVSEMASSLVLSVIERNSTLFNVIDIRNYDNYTYSHSLYVATLGVLLGSNLRLPNTVLTDLATAGILHDIGKLELPLGIVNKPGPLTDDEYDLVKEHPLKAFERLEGCVSYRTPTLQGVISHHECYDGSGYPMGLAGENIPLFGRILAISDVYDALGSNRSYRNAWQPGEIVEYMMSRSGTQFDPEILTTFLHSVAAYPNGTLVQLSDRRVGIVIENHAAYPLRPTVRILYPPEVRLTEVDLSHEQFNVTILGNLTGEYGDLEKLGLYRPQSQV